MLPACRRKLSAAAPLSVWSPRCRRWPRRAFRSSPQGSAARHPGVAGPAQDRHHLRFEPQEIAKIKAVNPKVQIDVVVCASPAEFREKVETPRWSSVISTPSRWRCVEAEVDPVARSGSREARSGGARQPVVVTNYQRTFAPGITETAMGMLLCLTRGIVKNYMPQFYKRQMKPVGTAKSADHTELVGRTMGIVGMGGIGTCLPSAPIRLRYACDRDGYQAAAEAGRRRGATRPHLLPADGVAGGRAGRRRRRTRRSRSACSMSRSSAA